MKILINGGAGFLGKNLVHRCLEEPDVQITVLDSLHPHFMSHSDDLVPLDRVTFIEGDVSDEGLLAKIVKNQDVIYNIFGQSSHPLSVQKPLIDTEINCIGHIRVLEAVKNHNPDAVVIYSSSSTVIGKALKEVVDEYHPQRPLEIYSANKAAAENYYRVYQSYHDLKTVMLRFANLYGPYGKPSPEFGFINYFISQAIKNETIKVFGDGSQIRNVMYAGDAADLLFKAASVDKLWGGLFFATSPFYLSLNEIAKTIVSVFETGSVENVPWSKERERMEIGSVRFSSKKLEGVLPWKAKHDFEAGLLETKRIMKACAEDVA